ncbi:MAG: 50S ribosomal protein L17 [Candidatus Kapaibacterium sp.]
MRHNLKGRKLKRTSSHKKALMSALATALFEHKKISTTEAKAKELRPYAEGLITKAKKALAREKQNLLPEGQKIDIHNRRLVGRQIHNKAVLQELFDNIAPAVEDRPGGYTRIIKTGFRRGDAGRTAIIELVDWAAPQDGTVSLKGKKKRKPKPAPKAAPKPEVAEKEQEKLQDAEEEITKAVEDQPKAEEKPEAAASESTEAPAEEPKAEETPAEEEKAEEPKAEETKAEEKEENKAEEKPEEEKKDEDKK